MSLVLMINGSPNKEGCTFTALNEVSGALKKRGIDSEIVWLGKKPIPGCIACMKCKETGRCVFDDEVNRLGARLAEFDALILGSPVYYAGPSGQICSFCDRLFFSTAPRMYGKPGAAVVSCRRGGATAAFDRLNKYFGISNMPTVGSQYWNQVHGYTPEDVRKDAEGLQIMRALGENMGYLLQCLKAGAQNGVRPPVYEPRIVTNFID